MSLAQKGVNQKTGEGLSEKTQKPYICFISDVMKYAIKCGLITNNPCKNISVVKTEKKEKEAYSLEELKEILNRINKKAPTDYKIFFPYRKLLESNRAQKLKIDGAVCPDKCRPLPNIIKLRKQDTH